jgi:hypothetical protein
MKRILLPTLVLVVLGLLVFGTVYELKKQAQRRREAVYQSALRATPPSQSPGAKHTSTDDPDPGSGEDLPCPQGRKQTAEARFRDYVIRTYRWPEPEGCLQILKRGTVVYSLASTEFKIGNNFYGFHNGANIPTGTDITGAGKPNAIVSEWSGGAHCCFTMHVFEIGDHFEEIARIEADDSDGAHFVDLDHDGFYEFEGNDWAFAYWGASFMDSPAPRIVLKYRDGRFRLAFDLMRKPRPSPQDLARMAHVIESDSGWNPEAAPDCADSCDVPIALWKNMLELMYGGHTDLAWRLFDESWPARQRGKSAFVVQFCKQLNSSHYWADLKEAIGACPPDLRP